MLDMTRSGQTTTGRPVIGGLWTLREQDGLPLDEIVAGVLSRGAVPDWLDLLRDMTASGMPVQRAAGQLKTAAVDAWPECAGQICAALDWCAENWPITAPSHPSQP